MPQQIGYAIAGKCGLYVGWWLRRVEAIAKHVSDLYGCSGFVMGRSLTTEQRDAWEKCKRRGDRAVRVQIRF